MTRTILALAALAGCLAGCLAAAEPAAESPQVDKTILLKDIKLETVRYILIGAEFITPDDEAVRKEIKIGALVEDRTLAQSIFKELQECGCTNALPGMVMPPRPILFLDERKAVVCGFLFSPASRGKSLFHRFGSFRENDKYFLGPPRLENPKEQIDLVKKQFKNALLINNIPHRLSGYFNFYK